MLSGVLPPGRMGSPFLCPHSSHPKGKSKAEQQRHGARWAWRSSWEEAEAPALTHPCVGTGDLIYSPSAGRGRWGQPEDGRKAPGAPPALWGAAPSSGCGKLPQTLSPSPPSPGLFRRARGFSADSWLLRWPPRGRGSDTAAELPWALREPGATRPYPGPWEASAEESNRALVTCSNGLTPRFLHLAFSSSCPRTRRDVFPRNGNLRSSLLCASLSSRRIHAQQNQPAGCCEPHPAPLCPGPSVQAFIRDWKISLQKVFWGGF